MKDYVGKNGSSVSLFSTVKEDLSLVWTNVNSESQQHIRKCWKHACEKAGLVGRIPHDFRRVAVTRFEYLGISRKVAMQLVGHETESIYNRYTIVRQRDLEEAVSKLNSASNSRLAISGVKK
jgi:integrase